MKKYTLTAKKRSVVGRKVKNLRKAGELPATVYGKKVKSTNITVVKDAFERIYGEAGGPGLVELSVDGDVRPVLIHSVQKDPVSEAPLHVEFRQVDLKEKVHAKVPVELVGDCPAVTQKLGVLLTVLNDIEVEALPSDLPEKIIVDVAALTEVNQEIKVDNITVPSGVTVLTEKTLTVVKVGPLITKEAEAQAAAEAAEAAQAAAVAGEGAAPEAAATEGEVPKAEEGAPAAKEETAAPPAKEEKKS